MGDLNVNLCGIELDNPIIPASGTFGYGYEFAELYDINCLGTFSFKGTTLEPRAGNPLPRIAEGNAGMLNAVGLQNPGVDAVISEELPKLAKVFHKPVIANVSGFSVAEYAEVCGRLDAEPQVGWLEVNISCPNVHGGGMSFGTDPKAAAEVTRAVKRVTTKPVIVKLSPNVTDIVSIAKACEDAGADAVSLINTVMSMRIDLKTRRPVLANTTGGLSGPAIFPLALRMVWQVYETVKIPILGLGGVSSAEDVIEMMLAGATAVQVGAANLVDPNACRDIIEALPKAMERYGIEKLSDITGGAHEWEKT
ncbi:MAG: dihydroorotate dehydrogenase [Oscillospiraceae bacterium]|nr:dihydroorotate dehydrogenase [Oscillospiraceae bacterium]